MAEQTALEHEGREAPGRGRGALMTGVVFVMPNRAQCQWCGDEIPQGALAVWEGRILYHLERCAPGEYREGSLTRQT